MQNTGCHIGWFHQRTQLCTNGGPVMQRILEVGAMSMPGLQFDLIVRPTLCSHMSAGIKGVERGIDPCLHLCFGRITVFQVDFRRLEFIEEDLVRGSCKECGHCHLRSML